MPSHEAVSLDEPSPAPTRTLTPAPARARSLFRRRTPLALTAGACAAALALAACSSGGGPTPAPPRSTSPHSAQAGPGVHQGDRIGSAVQLVSDVRAQAADPSAAGPLAEAEQRFSIALMKQLGGSGNVTVSPASLELALAMLENGASGTTRAQIAEALQAQGLSLAQQNAGWQALTAAWKAAAAKGGFSLSAANSLWSQNGFDLNPDFLATLKKSYDAGMWQVDFGKGSAAVDAINQWTSQHTDGKIPKLFDSLDPNTALVLADAVYFKAAWSTPFDAGDTHDALFHLDSGGTSSVHMMQNRSIDLPVDVTSDYTAAELPYQGGRFAALAIMPKSGSLSDFTASLTADRLNSITSSLTSQNVDLSLPKFTTTTNSQLDQVLSSMGMSQAFDDGADFSAMTGNPVKVTQVVQRDYLSVGEKGTTAAAATGVGVGITALPAGGTPVTFDHPFLFLIRDVKTGAVVFESQVADPAA